MPGTYMSSPSQMVLHMINHVRGAGHRSDGPVEWYSTPISETAHPDHPRYGLRCVGCDTQFIVEPYVSVETWASWRYFDHAILNAIRTEPERQEVLAMNGLMRTPAYVGGVERGSLYVYAGNRRVLPSDLTMAEEVVENTSEVYTNAFLEPLAPAMRHGYSTADDWRKAIVRHISRTQHQHLEPADDPARNEMGARCVACGITFSTDTSALQRTNISWLSDYRRSHQDKLLILRRLVSEGSRARASMPAFSVNGQRLPTPREPYRQTSWSRLMRDEEG